MPTTVYNLLEGLCASAFSLWGATLLRRADRRTAVAVAVAAASLAFGWSMWNFTLWQRDVGHALANSDLAEACIEATLTASATTCALLLRQARRTAPAAFCFAVALAAALAVTARAGIWLLFTLRPAPDIWPGWN